MNQNILQEYNYIINEIEAEKKREFGKTLAVMVHMLNDVESKNDSEDENDDNLKEHEKEMLSLYVWKVSLECKLIYCHKDKYNSILEDDINQVVALVQRIGYEWKVSEETFVNAFELLMSLSNEYEEILLPFFPRKLKKYLKKYSGVSPLLFNIFIELSSRFERRGEREKSIRVLEYLADISKERNNRKNHLELLDNVMAEIGDRDPVTIMRISQKNIHFFENVVNDYAGDFYWFYGNALYQQEKIDDAILNYEKCYNIRKSLYGVDDWFTALPQRETAFLMYVRDKNKESELYLYEFVEKIIHGEFQDVEETVLKILEGKTIYFLLLGQREIEDLNRFDRYSLLYENLCNDLTDMNEPTIQKRYANNFRGQYYIEKEDYIQAEQKFLAAIQVFFSDDMPELLSIPQIKSNLLMVYYLQNDNERSWPLLMELLDLLESSDTDSGLSERDAYRIYTIMAGMETQSLLALDDEDLEADKTLLEESCKQVLDSPQDSSDDTSSMITYMIATILLIVEQYKADWDEQLLYLNAIYKIENDHVLFPLNQLQRVVLNLCGFELAWNIEDNRVEFFLKNSLLLSKKTIVPNKVNGTILIAAALFNLKNGDVITAEKYLQHEFNLLDEIWKSYVKYLNDERLLQILFPLQLQFLNSYAMLREIADIEKSYEKVLRTKFLASLVIKERNRIIYNAKQNSELVNEIHLLQNRINSYETEMIFRDVVKEYEEDKDRLRYLEAEFAATFPVHNFFTEITWDRLKEAVPDNSVIVEYVYTSLAYGKPMLKDQEDIEGGFDVYITQKRNGICKLNRITISDDKNILALSNRFLEILQAKSTHTESFAQMDQVDDIRIILYKKLIRPVLPFLKGFINLYIAPDFDLINLPFELLYDEEQECLEDSYHVVKIECARDFLYHSTEGVSSKGSLIIGNPQYDIREQDLGEKGIDEKRRLLSLQSDQIRELPFSQIEIERVGLYCKERIYTGNAASKFLLQNAEGYQNIHIATHGYFDVSSANTNSVYSTCLLFSGICNWLETGEISAKYGNGLITSDEISRLNLSSVQLTVLSSCLSGRNDVLANKGFHGLVGAFSAAGVKYVISNLWAADDFCTAVLMDAFYDQYIVEKQIPPNALNFAKQYLRTVTIGELRQKHWFDKKTEILIKETIDLYDSMDDRVRPFKDEAFWGGFTCYQCTL